MKLLCIAVPKSELIQAQMRPYVPVVMNEYEGEVAEVAEEGTYYILAGFPEWFYYHHELFAILPDTTADQMQEENRESIINIETVPA
jgi:hypothetical protein